MCDIVLASGPATDTRQIASCDTTTNEIPIKRGRVMQHRIRPRAELVATQNPEF